MSYYDVLEDMEKRRCKKCKFFVYSKRWGNYICGIGGDIQRNCENEHKKTMLTYRLYY